MNSWRNGPRAAASILFCLSLAGCQSGSHETTDVGVADQEQSIIAEGSMAPALTSAQQDALDAFNRGDKRLLGVQTRGISVPGVDEALLPILRERYGVVPKLVNDVIKNQDDRDSITEVFQYVRQYNEKMTELLREEL